MRCHIMKVFGDAPESSKDLKKKRINANLGDVV